MKKCVLLSASLLIGAISLMLVSCNREDPINTDEEVVVNEDPYKDWPKLSAWSEEETRVSYDGLQENESGRIFASHFDKDDIIFIVVNGENGIAQYQYKYVAKGEKWEPVNEMEAPYDANFDYYAYWNGKDSDLNSYLSATYDKTTGDDLIDFFARALREWSNNVINIKNQGTEVDFRAQDILTGTGEVKSANSVKFTLYHAMGLACIQEITGSPQTVRSVKTLINDDYYKWVEETTTDKIVGEGQGCLPYQPGDGWMYLWIPPKEIMGGTIISSDAKWSRTFEVGSRKFARFSLTKKEVQEKYEIKFGDIFYSDGSLSHNGQIYAAEGREPIGMVINVSSSAIEEAANEAIKSSQANFTNISEDNNRGNNNSMGTGFHALVMGLEDAKNGNKTALAWSNGHITVNESEFCPNYNTMFADISGYTKTKNVKDRADFSNTQFPAFYAAINYMNLGDQITSSGWFLPSSGQWLRLFDTIRNGAELHPYIVTGGFDDMPNRATWEAYIQEAANGDYSHIKPLGGEDAIGLRWAVLDILDEFYMNTYLQNAGGSSIKAPGIIFRSSTECAAGIAASFCIGGDTLGELTISNNKQKNTTSQMRVRAMLAF